ncbi:DNA-processing protein DprA [Congregibacter litoralis]|uniref:DNA protecting protein DprA n=1 Tax=Congregibacter litoralis KT71 TaxID=314285 RepID=A4A932_9GAMM|nr:DNA-processing protein DprA [Congregibacter litoralis]EAQ97574.1 DNA protecting protein DprA [Congregibacter litoralis KT71]
MDDMTREQFQILLSWSGARIQGLGGLLREYSSPDLLFSADWQSEPVKEQLSTLPNATQSMLLRARKNWPRRNPRGYSSGSDPGGSQAFIPLGAEEYPDALYAIPDPPPWLFCQGDPACLAQPAVAIVGSRRASHGGLRAAREIAGRLAAAGYTISSGLALGIDAAAHRGALETGRTVAVLASGLEQASPLRHRALAAEIAASGCVVSELPGPVPPSKHQFPRRNRIISGLTQATIIVEAALPSGSLHTAAAALEQGREVYTLPWSIFHEQGAGCRRLIRDGATPITAMDDLSALFPGVAPVAAPEEIAPTGPAARILRLLGDDGLSLRALHDAMDMSVPDLLALLSDLEVQGWLSSIDGRYCRNDCKPCQRQTSC